jgi:hypothetical protein
VEWEKSLLKILFYTDLKMVLLKIEAAEKSTAFGRKSVSAGSRFHSLSNAKTH